MSTAPPPTSIVAPSAAAAYLGVSPSTLIRLRKSGVIAAPIRLSVRRIGWRVTDLDAYLSRDTAADSRSSATKANA